jgi:hypothetical protein
MICSCAGEPAQKHVAAEAGDGDAGERAEPGIELLGHYVARGVEGDGSKGEDTDGV